MNNTVTVSTVHHAAHFGYGMKGANDLIQVDAIQAWAAPFPTEAKGEGFMKHVGYIDSNGYQHVIFVKAVRAAEDSVCERCKDVV